MQVLHPLKLHVIPMALFLLMVPLTHMVFLKIRRENWISLLKACSLTSTCVAKMLESLKKQGS
jgi:hypothetical protein